MADEPDASQFAYHAPTQEGGESSNLRRTPTHYSIVDTRNGGARQPKSTEGRSIFDTGKPYPRRRTPSIRLL